MFTRSKKVLIVIGILLCALVVMGGRSNVPTESSTRQAQGPQASLDVNTMLVEAFVVEVNLPALAKLGVSPIGEEPHAVSVADLLKCLDDRQARVIAGAKAASTQAEAAVQARRTTYVEQERANPPGAKSLQAYESGETFSVLAGGVSDAAPMTQVRVQFTYSLSQSPETARNSDVPPDRTTWEWSGTMILEPGRPAIAAATQNGEQGVFLLLTAHTAGQ